MRKTLIGVVGKKVHMKSNSTEYNCEFRLYGNPVTLSELSDRFENTNVTFLLKEAGVFNDDGSLQQTGAVRTLVRDSTDERSGHRVEVKIFENNDGQHVVDVRNIIRTHKLEEAN